MLEVNRTLTSLNLQWNEIGQEGALALAEAVQVNHTLTSLDLEFNDVGRVGVGYLATGIQENQSLLSMNLQGNRASPEQQAIVSASLDRNRMMPIIQRLQTDDPTLTGDPLAHAVPFRNFDAD